MKFLRRYCPTVRIRSSSWRLHTTFGIPLRFCERTITPLVADMHSGKKFPTLKEAEAFIGGTSNVAAKSGKTKYYGVAVGNKTGVYTDWKDVQIQIKGCKGADQQKFSTFDEAKAYVNSGGRNSSTPIRGDRSETSSLATGKMDKSVEPAPKRQKKGDAPPTTLTNGDIKYEPGMGLLPPDAVDGFDRNIKLDPDSGNIRVKTGEESSAVKQQPTGDFSGPIVVYTDGSSLGNGKVGAVAGVGVYFGPNDLRYVLVITMRCADSNKSSRNVSEPLRGKRQTNQRAELVAIARAMDHIPIDRSAEIVTDSNYSIQCLEKWFINWEKAAEKAGREEWFNSAGKSVENQDLIKPILARIRERESCGVKTKLTWIKGHNNDPGNVAADALAVAGSRSSTDPLREGHHTEVSETLRTTYRSPKEVQTEQALDRDGDEFEEIFANLKAENADDLGVDPEVLAATKGDI
jgi:ribonuclease HI